MALVNVGQNPAGEEPKSEGGSSHLSERNVRDHGVASAWTKVSQFPGSQQRVEGKGAGAGILEIGYTACDLTQGHRTASSNRVTLVKKLIIIKTGFFFFVQF